LASNAHRPRTFQTDHRGDGRKILNRTPLPRGSCIEEAKVI
jgi:hypothetical protein